MPADHYGHRHQVARSELLADGPLCEHCLNEGADHPEVATVADHQPPIALHTHVEGSGCCSYVPSCARHSYAQAGAVSQLVRRQHGRGAIEVVFDEPDPSPGPADPCWAVAWLADLLDVPDNATWPIFMSAPHPRAVGSYGARFEAEAEARLGQPLRWWQRLAARRLLEHDADGTLVWMVWLLTVARQVGKSHLVIELLLWAVVNVREFWRADDVLYTSRTLVLAEGVLAPALRWSEGEEEWRPWKSRGSQAVMYQERNSLLIRAVGSAYGSTNGLAVVDESWDVKPTDVAEGIRPTLLESEGSLGLVSTAHRRATSLTLNERQRAFEQLDAPSSRLILEWSARRDRDLDDRAGWREASPHWSAYREELIADALAAARSGEILDPDEPDPLKGFEAQYLNRWPVRQTRRGSGEPLFEAGAWASALITSLHPVYNRVAAIEDNYGRGLSVAVAGISPDERIAVTGRTFEDRSQGWTHVSELQSIDVFLVGATLATDPAASELYPVEPVGRREMQSAFSSIRSLVEAGLLTHDGSPDLAAQVIECRLRTATTGLMVASKGRADLVKAASWAVDAVNRRRSAGGGIS